MARIDVERVVERVFNRMLRDHVTETRGMACLEDARSRLKLHQGRFRERGLADRVAEIDAALGRIDAIEAQWRATRRKKSSPAVALPGDLPPIVRADGRPPRLVHDLLWETMEIDLPPEAHSGRKARPYAGEPDYLTRALRIPGYMHAAMIVQVRRFDPAILDAIAARALAHGVPNLVQDQRFSRYIWDAAATSEANFPRLFELAETGP